MSCNYFLLDGAYNETSLYNSPDPVQDMHYPCLVSYPFVNGPFPPDTQNKPYIPTNYDNMYNSYHFPKNQGT